MAFGAMPVRIPAVLLRSVVVRSISPCDHRQVLQGYSRPAGKKKFLPCCSFHFPDQLVELVHSRHRSTVDLRQEQGGVRKKLWGLRRPPACRPKHSSNRRDLLLGQVGIHGPLRVNLQLINELVGVSLLVQVDLTI